MQALTNSVLRISLLSEGKAPPPALGISVPLIVMEEKVGELACKDRFTG